MSQAQAACRGLARTPEIVTDDETRMLVPPGDVEALAAAIGRVLQDSAFRERLAARAPISAAAKFSLEASTNAHLDCYEDIAR